MNRVFKIRCSAIGKIMGKLKPDGELPQTAKTFLHEWYANDNEYTYSKYTEKGINVENDLIDFMADILGLGLAEKNTIRLEDEYFSGECDVNVPSCVIDVKAPWNRKTLQQQVLDGLDKDYEMQLKGYCHLYKKDKAILFFGLMNTPETNYSEEIVYEDMPINERWIAYNISADPEFIEAVKERVLLCRAYLERHDILVKSKLGRIN